MLKFGKKPKRSDPRDLMFANYLTPAMPPPPPTYSNLARVYQNLNTSDPTVLFPMDGNDKKGDCTIAALAHAATVYHGLVDKKSIAKSGSVVTKYLWLTHGMDNGLDELTVLKYWHKHIVFGDKALAYVSLHPKNHTNVMLAISMFGGVYLGFNVQENCVEEFQAGQPWTPGPLTNEGHAVYAVDYTASDLTVLTWGNIQHATWDWWDACVDEAFVILSQQAAQPDFAPGFNFAQLQADINAL